MSCGCGRAPAFRCGRWKLVSVTGDRKVTGSHGIELGTDALFEDVNPDVADVLFLPGGTAN